MAEMNPTILKNKGVPIFLYSVEPRVREKRRATVNDAGEAETVIDRSVEWVAITDADGEAVTIREWVKIDANVMSEIETHFGSLDGFQKMSEQRTSDSVRIALTMMLGLDASNPDDVLQVGARMVPEHTMDYQTAVMVCMSIANGVDPTKAARLLEEGRLAVKQSMDQADEAMEEAVEEMKEERLKAESAPTSPEEDSTEVSAPTAEHSYDDVPSSD